jgi:hypothetical protein
MPPKKKDRRKDVDDFYAEQDDLGIRVELLVACASNPYVYFREAGSFCR